MLCSKILVAYDGSEAAKEALKRAIELAGWDPLVEIEVLQVVTFPPLARGFSDMSISEIKEFIMEQGSEVLQTCEGMLTGIPNKYRTTVLEGIPSEVILEHAKLQGSDMIIMGSRGLTGLKGLFLGSVSHNVVQNATVPVFIVK